MKDVLQDLVDDGNVQFDKIGTSNCESFREVDLCVIFLFFLF